MKKRIALPIIGILCLALIGMGILVSNLDTRLAQAEEEVRWAQIDWTVEEEEPPSVAPGLKTYSLYISTLTYFVPECAAKEGFFWVFVEEMDPSEVGEVYIEFRPNEDFHFILHSDGTGTWELKPYLDE